MLEIMSRLRGLLSHPTKSLIYTNEGSDKPRISFNAILNLPGHHSIAAISGHATSHKPYANRDKKDCPYVWDDFSLNISDCSNNICLEFDAGTLKQIRNSRHKAEKIKQAMENIEVFLADAEDRLKKYNKMYPEKDGK